MFARAGILLFSALLAIATPAAAQDYVGQITDQLRDQGFARIETHRTLLGRARIVAVSDEGTREIIVNPNTGEILRDLWQPRDGGSDRLLVIGKSGSSDDGKDGSGGSRSGSGDDPDQASDDGSGSDGGASGSGTSGSGNRGSDNSGSGSSSSRSGSSGSDDSGSDDSGSDDSGSGDGGSGDGGSDSSGKGGSDD